MKKTLRERIASLRKESKAFVRTLLRIDRIALAMVPSESMVILLLAVLSSFASFAYSGAIALLVDELGRVATLHAATEHLYLYMAFAVGAALLPDLLSSLRDYFDRSFWLSLSVKLEMLATEARMKIDVGTDEDPKFHDTLTKASERSVYPMLNIMDWQFSAVTDAIALVIASFILLRLQPLFLLALFLGTLPRLYVGLRYGKSVWTMHDAKVEDRRRFFYLKHFPEEKTQLKDAHLLNIGGTILGKMRSISELFLLGQLAIERRKAWGTAIAVLFSLLATVFVYMSAINMLIASAFSLGTFLFLIAAVGQFEGPLGRLLMGISRQYEFALFAQESFRIIDAVPSLLHPKAPVVLARGGSPEIRFEHVSFRYPSSETDVLTDINLTIPAGTSFALVGINGAGKTTLVKLLCRFYDPTAGRILVDGVDLRDVDLSTWYQKLGILFQHFPTYESFTVAEGIALGDVTGAADKERVIEAARKSGADEFIRAWPKAYDQVLGRQYPEGVEPSRGQEQRLALARVFYRGAGCVILDEPTAAVDAEAEEHIFREIELMHAQTRILISHRFSTVRNADQICVLDGGKIRELGDHTSLMKAKGKYAELFEAQAKGYKE